jgi:hypothetical protein
MVSSQRRLGRSMPIIQRPYFSFVVLRHLHRQVASAAGALRQPHERIRIGNVRTNLVPLDEQNIPARLIFLNTILCCSVICSASLRNTWRKRQPGGTATNSSSLRLCVDLPEVSDSVGVSQARRQGQDRGRSFHSDPHLEPSSL